MRTNIDIDDKLMKQAMKATGTHTKKSAVEACMRQTIELKNQTRLYGGAMMTTGSLPTKKSGRSTAKLRKHRRKRRAHVYRRKLDRGA
jgi:Arc/MetJ family transcription regulator